MGRIITISREFGSGGRELGRRIAEHMKMAYYDKEILAEISKRTELAEQYIQSIMDSNPIFSFPINIGVAFHSAHDDMLQTQTSIFAEQCAILKEISAKSDCVIVGRCADYILAEQNPYRIFVYSNIESKIVRCRMKGKETEPLTDRELKRRIYKINKGREEYYHFFTGQVWGNKLNYDLCVNTTQFSVKDIAPYISNMLFDREK